MATEFRFAYDNNESIEIIDIKPNYALLLEEFSNLSSKYGYLASKIELHAHTYVTEGVTHEIIDLLPNLNKLEEYKKVGCKLVSGIIDYYLIPLIKYLNLNGFDTKNKINELVELYKILYYKKNNCTLPFFKIIKLLHFQQDKYLRNKWTYYDNVANNIINLLDTPDFLEKYCNDVPKNIVASVLYNDLIPYLKYQIETSNKTHNFILKNINFDNEYDAMLNEQCTRYTD